MISGIREVLKAQMGGAKRRICQDNVAFNKKEDFVRIEQYSL